jgi:ubiquinone biosynthesis protein COQ4
MAQPSTASSESSWTRRVRRADPAHRRPLHEARIALEALLEVSKDTGKTESAFEAIENFPLLDVIRVWNARLPIFRDPRFCALWADRSMPDLSREASVARTALPEGTLGRAYGRFVEARGLDNVFLEYLTVDSPETYLAYRIGHLHDLFHFLLGYDPYDPIGEMEIEAFLAAQTGAVNHLLFLLGYVVFLLRNDPGQLVEGRGRLLEAFRLGVRAAPLLLVRWEDEMDRPMADVKARLGIGHRPEARVAVEPSTPPRLAHVVYNVPDVERAVQFYRRVFGYEVAARDEALGVVFMTGGDDHHTIALGECASFTPWSFPRTALRGGRRITALVRSRLSGERSSDGRKRVLPPLSVVLAAVRQGHNHAGFRVDSERDLVAYARRLRSAGTPIRWAVNHGDMVKGIYFTDPAGNMIELFVDGERARELAKQREQGVPLSHLAMKEELRNYDLDLDSLMSSEAP